MQVLLLIVSLIFLVFLMPILIKVSLTFDILKNSGTINLSLFGLTIIKAEIKFGKNQISFLTSKKTKTLPIDFKDKHLQFVNKVIYNLILQIKIYQLNLFFDVEKENDAFTPTMLCGLFNSILNIFLAFVYTKKGVFNTIIKTSPTTKQNNFAFSFETLFALNLFMLIVSIFKAKQKREALYAYK